MHTVASEPERKRNCNKSRKVFQNPPPSQVLQHCGILPNLRELGKFFLKARLEYMRVKLRVYLSMCECMCMDICTCVCKEGKRD